MTDTPRPTVALRPLELLGALAGHDVEFVVIGGFSLAAHGVVRGTKDVDLVPEQGRDNLGRLATALAELDAKVDIGDLAPEELGTEPDVDGLSAGGNWVLRTRLGRLDVMQNVPGVRAYAQLRAGAVAIEVPGLEDTFLFAGLDELIAMKRAAGRPQDLIDIADLERARSPAS